MNKRTATSTGIQDRVTNSVQVINIEAIASDISQSKDNYYNEYNKEMLMVVFAIME